MVRIIILIGALAATWLIWSDIREPMLLALGALSIGLTLWIAVRMDLTAKPVFALDLIPRMFGLWFSLFIDVVRSALQVARIVLSPGLPVSPTLVKLTPGNLGTIGQATLANSITLSPGSITIDAHEGVFSVHCLTTVAAGDVSRSNLDERVFRAMGAR